MRPAAPTRRAALAFVAFSLLFDIISLGITLPVLPKLVVEVSGSDVGHGALVFGWFVTSWQVAHLLAAPLLGALSDRYGRRPIILISSLFLGLDYLLMAVSPTLSLLFVGRILSGVTSSTFPAAYAYVADVVPKEERTAAFGKLGAAASFGFIAGPAIGGALATFGLRVPFWVAGAFCLLNTLYGYFVLPESLPLERRTALTWASLNPFRAMAILGTSRRQATYACVAFLSFAAQYAFQSAYAIYTAERYTWSSGTLGLSIAAGGIAAVLGQSLLLKRLSKRFGDPFVLGLALLAGCLSQVTIALASVGAVTILASMLGTISALSRPALQSLMSREASDAKQGQLQGALTSLHGIAGCLVPSLFVRALTWGRAPGHPVGAPFFLAGAALAVAFVVAAMASKRQSPAKTS